jgi:molybdate transport system substrate-binding protein
MITARALITAACLLGGLAGARADEIRVLTGNAVSGPQKLAAEAFTARTGHKVTFFSTNPSIIQQKVDAGEPFELYVIPSTFVPALDKAGRIAPGSAHLLARVGVGVAAKENGPKFDFSTPEAFKKMLLDAHAVTYSDASSGGLSALSVQKVLQSLGVADIIRTKAIVKPQGQELIASGEVDFGLFNVSEIPRAKGVVLAGALPAAIQAYLDYDAALPAMNKSPGPAKEFAAFLASRDAKTYWAGAGIDQAGQR